MQKNKVSIIGLGYVGLPLAYTIAKNKKYNVCGLDLEQKKIDQINDGTVEIDDVYAKKLIKQVKITASTDPDIIKDSEYIIICVPTPVKDDNMPDLSPVKSATQTVAKYLEKGQKIILESTINPGISEEIALPILEESGLKGGQDFELTHCPERINPGDQKWNIKNIARNIGSLSIEGNKEVADFYRSFLDGEINELSTIKAAEATKIIENTFRDINIAFVNELAKSFDIMGIDLYEVINAASNKPFAFMAHYPSCGVGGHCIPVDPYYLIAKAKQNGFSHSFLKKARELNNSMPAYTVELLEKKTSIKGTPIALLGLSYKPNVPDLRNSPSLEIEKILKEKGANLLTFDPLLPELSSAKSLEEALNFADVIVLSTNHDEFKNLTAETLNKHKIKIVIDGKNCLNKEELIRNNIIYKGIGR